MATRYDKDITITINGETKGLSTALKTLDADLKNAQQNVKALDTGLKLDPTNVDLAKKKMEALNEVLELTKKRLSMLNEALEKAKNTSGIDKTSQQFKNLESDTKKVAQEVENLQTEYNKLGDAIGKSNDEIVNFTTNSADYGAQFNDLLDNAIAKYTSIGTVIGFVVSQVNVVVDGLKNTASVLGNIATTIGSEIIDIMDTGTEYNAQIESYKVRLASFAQVGEKAGEVFQQLKEDALKSPFSVDAIMQATTMLLATGASIEDVRKTVLSLGDAIAKTGGDDSTLTRMAQNLQQVANAGKASSIDIKQFATAGIDIYGLLKEYENLVYESASETPVTYEQITNSLIKASQEGGKYFNGMSILADTFTGKLNKLEANWTTLTGVIAESTSSMLGGLIDQTNNAINGVISALEDGDLQRVSEILKEWVYNCLTIVNNELPQIIAFITELMKTAINALNSPEVLSALKETITMILNGLSTMINGIIPAIKEVVAVVLNAVKEIINTPEVKLLLSDIANQIATIIGEAFIVYLKAKWGAIFTALDSIQILSPAQQYQNNKQNAQDYANSTKYYTDNTNGHGGGGGSFVTVNNYNEVTNDVDVEAISKKTAQQVKLITALK